MKTPKDIQIIKRRSRMFLERSLKIWAAAGYDNAHGGYVEALAFDGTALLFRDKRFRVQGRTMFAHAAGTLWGYYDGLLTAERAFEFVTQKCMLPSGGFVSTTAADGTHIDKYIRTYEHAFLLLGLGWLSYVSKKSRYKEELMRVWNFISTKLRHPDGYFLTSIPPKGAPEELMRLQNPHMHLFEALLNLYELFKDAEWLREARNIYSLLQIHIFHEPLGVLLEFFTDDWKPDAQKGTLIDPGHHCEWTWLLYKYEKLSGERAPIIDALYSFAVTKGTDEHGLCYDEMRSDGTVYKNTRRLWVQTEALKAHLAMAARTADADEKNKFFARADSVLEQLFAHYFIEELGIWKDQLNHKLHNISMDAPASTVYHVLGALNEYITLR